MSASLTAMLATSFFNYQVENLHLWGTFTLRIFLTRFKEYLSSMLLEEEALSCGFFLVDLVKEEIETALFGLPPLLLRSLNGTVTRICGENPPIGIYPSDTHIGTLSLTGVADMLVMTDGVSDALLTSGGSYREVLESDFHAAPTLAALQRRFFRKIHPETSDDLTLMHLRRLDFNATWSWKGKIERTPDGSDRTIQAFLDALAGVADVAQDERTELENLLSETLTNVREKREAVQDAEVALTATLWHGAEKPLLLMEVNGTGLPDNEMCTDSDETFVNGHGPRSIHRSCDSQFTDTPGGSLIILKTLEGENTNAD